MNTRLRNGSIFRPRELEAMNINDIDLGNSRITNSIPTVLPTDSKARKAIPLCTGVLDYFPAALAEVAKVSVAGNNQHNPGQELHWSRNKSSDFADTIARHLLERGGVDTDGIRHSAKLAWRALAMLQHELEQAGLAPLSRGSRYDVQETPALSSDPYAAS